MTFVGHIIKLFVLTLIQAHLSFPQGIFRFANITTERKTHSLRSGQCCGSTTGKLIGGVDIVNTCSIPCQITFSLCLIKFGDRNKLCLIDIEARQAITDQTKTLDLKFTRMFGEALSLILIARDLNSSPGDNVVFEADFYNQPLTFVDSHWNQVTSSSTNQLLSFSYRLNCGKNLYGKTCNSFCKPKDDATGHYTCSEDGSRICLHNWYGDYCDRRCNCHLYQATSHGTCLKNGKCACHRGWTGIGCHIDLKLCITTPCQNGGNCNQKSGVCHCPVNTTGKYCEQLVILPSSSIKASIRQPTATSTISRTLRPEHTKSTTTIKRKSSSPRQPRETTVINASTSSNILSTPALVSTSQTYGIQASSSMSTAARASTPLRPQSTQTKPSSPPSSSSVVHTGKIPTTTKTSTNIDVSKLIATTVWIPLTKPTNTTTNTTITPTTHPTDPTRGTVIAVTSVTVGVVLFLAIILFWFLWRRKRQYRRKSQASTIVPITLNSSSSSTTSSDCSRPSTFSSTRSISPLMSFLYEKNNTSGELEPPDIEIISVLNEPVRQDIYDTDPTNFQEEKTRCYTLQEVDKMCTEAINNTTKQKKSSKQNRTSKRVRVSKTLSNGSCKSQYSSNYSSSGYGSGSSSPALNQTNSSTSLIGGGRRSANGQYPTPDKRLDHFTVQTNGSRSASLNNNNNNNNDTNRMTSSKDEARDQNFDEDDDFYHQKGVINNRVHFEGLPNFIAYKEDTKV